MTSNRYTISVGDKEYSVELLGRSGSQLSFSVQGTQYSVEVRSDTSISTPPSPGSTTKSSARESTSNEVRSPMPGIISDVKIAAGTQVNRGDTLVVIEAMKMENPIKAPRSGIIKEVLVSKGQEVAAGVSLLTFD